ncbi:MAG: hypothetical protein WC701_09740 [Kiritimatiellales bacterium]|jgi:hypothetical protein
MSDRDLGTMGEREFGKKCASVGITASFSNPDRNGWDAILELDSPEGNSSQMLDKKPPQIKCLVQVKATDSKTKNSWSITLSNLKKLVDFAGPAFVVLMRFSGEEDVQEIYFTHVDGSILRLVMRRLRELSIEGGDSAKSTLNIKFGKHKLLEPTGASIRQKILNVVSGSGADKYISDKQRVRETVGYERGRHKVTFTPKDADAAKALSGAMLGVPAMVPVINVVRQEDIRFDMPARVVKDGEAFVSLKMHPYTAVEVFFQGMGFSEPISFLADVYVSPVLHTVRLDLKMFDMVCSLDTREASWNITHTEDTAISLELFHKFYSLVSEVENGKSYQVGIKVGQKILPFLVMSKEIDARADGFLVNQKQLSLYAKKILRHFSFADALVTRSLLNQQGVNLHIFAQALEGISEPVNLTVPSLDGLNLEEKVEYTTVFPAVVRLGDNLFCAILKIKGRYVKEGSKHYCRSNESTLLETFQLPKSDMDGYCEILDSKLSECAKQEGVKTTITINRMNRDAEKALFMDVNACGSPNK